MDNKQQKTSSKTTTTKTAEKQEDLNKDNSNQNKNTTTNNDKNANKTDNKTASKKDVNKLNPVKSKGKNSEAEKKALKQKNEEHSGSKNVKFAGGKNSKKEKKEPEKELYLRFGKHVLNAKEEECDLDENTFLRYNVIGILFTGSWVPPAKEFMTKLEDLYAEINKSDKIFEIVQIPNEKTEQAYKESITEKRQWLYLPFNDPFIKTLVEQFNVEYLPTFIIVNRDFFILSNNGRKDMIDNEGVKSYEKWYKAYRDRKQAVENEREEKEEQLNRAEA